MILILLASFAPAAAQEEDWVTHQGERTYIKTPPAWVNLTDPAQLDLAQKNLTNLANQNPLSAEIVMAAVEPLKQESIDLLLLDTQTAASASITLADMAEAADLEDMTAEIFDQFEELGGEVLDTDILNLPAGEAYFAHVKLPEQLPISKEQVFEQHHYYLVNEAQLITVVLGSPTEVFADLAPTLEAMIQTFGIGEAPADEVGVGVGGAPVTQSGIQHSILNVRLTAPEDWLNISDSASVEAYFASGKPADPAAQGFIESMQGQVESGSFALVLVYPPNVGFVLLGVNDFADVAISIVEDSVISSIESDDEIQLLGSELIEIPAGEALRVDVVRPIRQDILHHEIRLLISRDAKLYTFYFAIPDEVYADYEAIFETMINTITFEE